MTALRLQLSGSVPEHLWLQSPSDAQRWLRVLEAIERSGSISQGAKTLRVSYKTAWSLVESINNLASEPLVIRTVGGRTGGGTQLTAQGQAILQTLRQGARHFEKLLAGAYLPVAFESSREKPDGVLHRDEGQLIQGGGVPNQFLARVRSIDVHSEQVRAVLEIAPGHNIIACGARGTVDPRMRSLGRSVVIHVNPSAIVLAVGESLALSADNQLTGTVKRMRRGPVQCEVVVQLLQERVLTVLVTSTSAERLRLRRAMRVTACFSAEAVTLLSV